MSGWLLQYPVVYLADQDSAVTLAKLLSEAVLVLYDVHIDGPLVKVNKHQHCCQAHTCISSGSVPCNTLQLHAGHVLYGQAHVHILNLAMQDLALHQANSCARPTMRHMYSMLA